MSLPDKELWPRLQPLYRAWAAPCAALHPVSLYLWKREMQLTMTERPGLFAVQLGWRGTDAWSFPCGEDRVVAAFLKELTARPGVRLCYGTARQVAQVERLMPGAFAFARTPADDEYLYDPGQQLALRGRAFRHQRNALHRVEALGTVRCRALDDQTLASAREVVDTWCCQSHHAVDGLVGADAARRLLDIFDDRLQGVGVVVYEQERPAALAAGYSLTEDCFDLALCIQPGQGSDLAVYARHQLFARLAGRWHTVNAEEDLGLAGLRTLKQKMVPSGLLEMYEGTLHER